jgi:2',3'-cyclic-nucleotide 2'-phosphodiesterase (5'-nucleotidase family)
MVGLLGFVDNWITDLFRDDEIEFLDIFSTAKSLSADLKARGAQVVIALTHCGRQRVDEKLSTIDNIDIVLGGHSKSQLESWTLSDSAIGLRSTPGYSHLTNVRPSLALSFSQL